MTDSVERKSPIVDTPADSDTEVSGGDAPINEKRLLRKLDYHLLPAVGVLYLLSFLDRSNVGNARIEGMLDDLHMTGNQYLTGLTLYFVAYVLFEYRISLFFSAASLAGAFGGVLAYGIGRMSGIVWQHGWRWIFILEGILTVIVAIAAYWFIHNYPDTAKFLTPDERRHIHQRLAADSDATNDEKFTWSAVSDALKDVDCWLYGLGFHTMSLPLYTLSLFLPRLHRRQSPTPDRAPYAFAFLTTIAAAVLSERTGQRALFIGGAALFGAVGYAILLSNTAPRERPGVSYAGTFFAAGGIYPAVALVLSWPAINVSGQTKRAVANALQISVGNLGAVLGTQLYRAADGPRFIVGHSVALAYLLANVLVVSLLWWRLRRENRRRDNVAAAAPVAEGFSDWKGDADPRWRFEY
ncbi:uncharacterized protein PG998_004246 [Apiospora kogelbergensis]|uniref:uncharacterized protein n=1 Tax=Apiospora kogelbergensis TaxID=1337665 RepID=UPI00312F1DB1